MSESFASLPALIDAIIKEEVHDKQRQKYSLFLTTSAKEPFHFYDVSKVRLVFSQDDLESYLLYNPQINHKSTVFLDDVGATYECGKHNSMISC